MKRIAIAVILVLMTFNTAYGDWLEASIPYEKECLKIFKEHYNINMFVKATNVEEIDSNKYEFTPVMVVRGKESKFTRQYCEYYPEENMVYIGKAQSAIDAEHKKKKKALKLQMIQKEKRAEAEEKEAENQAELREIQRKFEIEQAAKEKKKADLARSKRIREQERQEKIAANNKVLKEKEAIKLGTNCLKKNGIKERLIYVDISEDGRTIVNYNDWKVKAVCAYPNVPPKKVYRVYNPPPLN